MHAVFLCLPDSWSNWNLEFLFFIDQPKIRRCVHVILNIEEREWVAENLCTKIFNSLLCFPSPANDPNNFGRYFLFSSCYLIRQLPSLPSMHAITGTTNPYCENVNKLTRRQVFDYSQRSNKAYEYANATNPNYSVRLWLLLYRIYVASIRKLNLQLTSLPQENNSAMLE